MRAAARCARIDMLRRGAALLACAFVVLACCGQAGAEGLTDLGGAEWRLEQPPPPKSSSGTTETGVPIGLGRIGDIEFWAPNRGLLITAGNPPTIPPGIWVYNGQGWHELAEVCGATDGRIAWAGGDEFWTVSDGRPGQATSEGNVAPEQDDTLCRFAGGKVAESFAAPAFLASSYMPMHAAACIGPDDCWFAGDPLPEGNPEVGSFHLHWNGTALVEEPYLREAHSVQDMRAFAGRLYESVRLRPNDALERRTGEPPVLHATRPEEPASTFEPVAAAEVPLTSPFEFPDALDFLHLSSSGEALWGAAGPQEKPPESEPGQVTVARSAGGAFTQILGPETHPTGAEVFGPSCEGTLAECATVVTALAAEPSGSGEEGAWLGLDGASDARVPGKTALASVARIGVGGAVSPEDRVTLPSAEELPTVGPKGGAYRLTCPAPHDCWLATTQGWLFHLAPPGERTLPEDTDPAFAGLITERPEDKGLPQVPPDSLPPDTSGLGEAPPPPPVITPPPPELRIPVPLVSHVRSHLRGDTLQVSFHLAVKARMGLVALRKHRVVARTPMRVLRAGNRSLQLRLDPKRWPTALHFQEHALAPLPTVSSRGSTESLSTSLAFPRTLESAAQGLLR
jgi:hypothetical protein